MRAITTLLLLSIHLCSKAQPGALDPTYGNNGAVVLQPGTWLDLANQVIAAPDTTAYTVGTATPDSVMELMVSHLMKDGSLDTSFGEAGYAFIGAGSNTQGVTIARTAEGALVAAGTTLVGQQTDLFLCKLTPQGELDGTFGNGGTLVLPVGTSFDYPQKLLLTPDGRIVIAGASFDANGVLNGVILRLQPDGSWDTSFSGDGKLFFTQFAQADRFVDAAFTSDGGIVAVGSAVVGVPTVALMAKANADGEWDTAFGQGGWDTLMIDQYNLDYAGGVVMADEKIVICGTTWDLTGADGFVARMEAQGGLDQTFGSNGIRRIDQDEEDELYDVALDTDGGILACGTTRVLDLNDRYDLLFARLDPDGQPDGGFGAAGLSIIPLTDTTDKVFDLDLQPDGGILACGYTVGDDFDMLVIRMNGGTCDTQTSISPASPILCPGVPGILTADAGDDHQWYRNGDPVIGATEQTLTVSAADVGSWFSVQVWNGACTAVSDSVLVDGYVFLLPTIINNGDQPNTFGDDGEQIYCDGDTALLTLGQPYDTNIQWYDFGVPIPGANSTVLAVTGSGSYSVQGAPAVCPAYIQDAGVTVTTEFRPIIQPVVVESGILYCPEPEGLSAQWYFNGNPFVGLEQCCIPLFSGDYTVLVDYGDSCSVLSEPFFLVGVEELSITDMKASPVPTADQVTVTWSQGETLLDWRVIDATGRVVASGVKATSPLRLELDDLDVGQYRFLTGDGRSLPLLVVR